MVSNLQAEENDCRIVSFISIIARPTVAWSRANKQSMDLYGYREAARKLMKMERIDEQTNGWSLLWCRLIEVNQGSKIVVTVRRSMLYHPCSDLWSEAIAIQLRYSLDMTMDICSDSIRADTRHCRIWNCGDRDHYGHQVTHWTSITLILKAYHRDVRIS